MIQTGFSQTLTKHLDPLRGLLTTDADSEGLGGAGVPSFSDGTPGAPDVAGLGTPCE